VIQILQRFDRKISRSTYRLKFFNGYSETQKKVIRSNLHLEELYKREGQYLLLDVHCTVHQMNENEMGKGSCRWNYNQTIIIITKYLNGKRPERNQRIRWVDNIIDTC